MWAHWGHQGNTLVSEQNLYDRRSFSHGILPPNQSVVWWSRAAMFISGFLLVWEWGDFSCHPVGWWWRDASKTGTLPSLGVRQPYNPSNSHLVASLSGARPLHQAKQLRRPRGLFLVHPWQWWREPQKFLAIISFAVRQYEQELARSCRVNLISFPPAISWKAPFPLSLSLSVPYINQPTFVSFPSSVFALPYPRDPLPEKTLLAQW